MRQWCPTPLQGRLIRHKNWPQRARTWPAYVPRGYSTWYQAKWRGFPVRWSLQELGDPLGWRHRLEGSCPGCCCAFMPPLGRRLESQHRRWPYSSSWLSKASRRRRPWTASVVPVVLPLPAAKQTWEIRILVLLDV